MNRKRLSYILTVLGLLLIAGALLLCVRNWSESVQAGREAGTVTEALTEMISVSGKKPYDDAPRNSEGVNDNSTTALEMQATEVNGNRYIGVLEFPSESVCLPVMSEWNYDSLRISPCIYTGSFYMDDAVICGHNYITHFGFLLRIGIGTDVYFTSINGEIFHYVVSNRETVRAGDIDSMIDPSADWDLTLFTCDLDGRTRCAVRCVRENN